MAKCAPRLEVGEKRLWRDVSVKHLRVSEFLHPCILNDCEDEMRNLSPHRLLGATVGVLGFLRRFRARTDDIRGIFIYCRVVGANSCGFGKLRTIARRVRCNQPNEADEVVCASRFVIRDLEEERRHDLPDSREVGV